MDGLASISDADLASFQARLEAARDQRRRENRLAHYKPYARQLEFHQRGAVHRERLFMAGNQLGKCATAATYMELADGTQATFGELYERNQPFLVKSWNGSQLTKAWAIQPIRKPAEPCVRLWFEDGSWFECAERHRVLRADGQYAFVGDLLSISPHRQPCDAGHPVSNLAPGRLAHVADERHFPQRLRGFPAGCLAGLRFCDARLHAAQSFVRAFVQQLADAPRYNFVWSGVGGYSSTHTSTGLLGLCPPSSRDGVRQSEGRFFASLDRGVCRFAQYTRWNIQAAQRLLLACIAHLRSNGGEQCDQSLQGAYAPSGREGNRIIAYELIPSQEVYDFSVPETGCYVANGIVHHNTLAGGMEAAMHATGRYPEWWPGRRFDHPTVGWVGGVTSEAVRDGAERILLGRAGERGTGTIPKAAIRSTSARTGVPDSIATVKVDYVSGGVSTIIFKSYDQGREKWQGDTIDWLWPDEEPPEAIYTEGLTRTNAGDNGKGGIVFVTFTPLLGMSNVVKRFLLEKQEDRNITSMTIDDVEHYSAQQKASIIASYPEHEREARTKGIPALGSGRIFPVAEDRISYSPFSFPKYWRKIAGIDFGWDHPTACVWLAYDPDGDCVYIFDAYRARQQTPIIHSAAIRAKGLKIPVAWPHDGINETAGGQPLATQYRQQGIAMLPEKAAYQDERGNHVEPGLMDMLDRMQTGRLKVASHLADWWEEFRLYHRKDGKIVKEGDDLMSATRYAIMMLRFARADDSHPSDRYRRSGASGSGSAWAA